MTRYMLSLCMALLFCGSSHTAYANRELTQNYLRPAILKITVSYPNAIFDDNDRNVCSSEGTGFIVGKEHVVTAEHVFDLRSDCGQPTIVASSFYGRRQWILTPVDVNNDVALLRAEPSLDPAPASKSGIGPCAVNVSIVDVYDIAGTDDAVRYGIPAGLQETTPIGVSIGSAEGQFDPKVQVTPTKFEPGESGGPVVSGYQVIGVMRESVVAAQFIGLMMPASFIHDLLQKNGVHASPSEECNTQTYAETIQLQTIIRQRNRLKGVIVLDREGALQGPSVDFAKDSLRAAITESFPGKKFDFEFDVTDAGISFEVVGPEGYDFPESTAASGNLLNEVTAKYDQSLTNAAIAVEYAYTEAYKYNPNLNPVSEYVLKEFSKEAFEVNKGLFDGNVNAAIKDKIDIFGEGGGGDRFGGKLNFELNRMQIEP